MTEEEGGRERERMREGDRGEDEGGRGRSERGKTKTVVQASIHVTPVFFLRLGYKLIKLSQLSCLGRTHLQRM